VRAFDPTVVVPEGAGALAVPRIELPDDLAGSLLAYPDAYSACEGAAAVVVLTEWDEFRWLDFVKVRDALVSPVLVDARNLLDPAQVRRLGFSYVGIGRR
jgi:UDPglucose 6-dehydrogenase